MVSTGVVTVQVWRTPGRAILESMASVNLLSEEFAQAAAMAGLRARQSALASGYPVVFLDESGRYIEERPDGRRLEIRFQSGTSRDSHLRIVRELTAQVG